MRATFRPCESVQQFCASHQDLDNTIVSWTRVVQHHVFELVWYRERAISRDRRESVVPSISRLCHLVSLMLESL